MLRDIIAQPTRPLALGRHGDEDFVDLLLRLIPAEQGPLRKALTICLLCYDDPRTADFIAHTFPTAHDAETVFHLAERLAHKGVPFFQPFLWTGWSAQAVAAARICRQAGGLEPRDQLRVALLLEGADNPLPPLGEVWLAELEGPHRDRARGLAETLGEQVLWLWSAPLPDFETDWLLKLTLRLDPERARAEAQRLLDAGRVTLTLLKVALELGVSLPRSLLEHADPEVRAVAISVGLADEILDRYLKASVPEAVAALRRAGSDVHVALLSDSRWEVRAAAVNRLTDCSPRPLEQVQALVGSGSKGERVAAVELLRRWGEVEWLEENLLAGTAADEG